MLKLENFEIVKDGELSYSPYYITIPFNKDFPLLQVNFDLDSVEVEADGVVYMVNDCLVSDNGEWINLVCNRIFTDREEG